MKILKYIISLAVLAFTSCRDFQINLSGDSVLAQVGATSLMQSELSSVVPQEYHGEDSVVFVELYIDKWIRKQVKLREAERIFVASQEDVEAKVEEYRQSLLIKRLDEHFVRSSIDTLYTEREIEDYYQINSNNFRLNREIIKGEIMRLPLDDKQTKKLVELMKSDSETKRKDLLSICEKNGYEFIELSSSWILGTEMLDYLPLTRGDKTSKLLSQSGVNHVSDDNYDYYYQILEYKKVGDVAPLEWVSATIRQILINERQQNLVKSREDKLYLEASSEGIIKRQYQSFEKSK